jgi:hypothetical protein
MGATQRRRLPAAPAATNPGAVRSFRGVAFGYWYDVYFESQFAVVNNVHLGVLSA